MPLLEIADLPRVVRLAGRDRPVYALRPADLAEFEALAAASRPCPTAGVPPRDDPGFDAAWSAAYARAERAAGGWGSPGVAAAMATPAGMAVFLWAALRRGDPGLTLEAAAALLPEVADAEWVALGRAAWGADPLGELEALLDGPRPADGPPARWEERIAEVVEATGLDYEVILRWPLPRLASFLRRGKPPVRGTPVDGMSPEDIQKLRDERKRRFGKAGG
jgi:hypothetical protein